MSESNTGDARRWLGTAGVTIAALGLVVLLVWTGYTLRERGDREPSAPGTGVGSPDPPVAERSGGLASTDPAAMAMSAGLAATDPTIAADHFRRALNHNPMHYGASFQLARSLDLAGRRQEARVAWLRVLRLGEEHEDEPVAATARARLAALGAGPDGAAAQAELMTLGMEALHARRDARAAAAHFREVLALNPEHYGATFQLATALDAAGQRVDARPLWTKVLKAAEAIDDAATIAKARARLAAAP